MALSAGEQMTGDYYSYALGHEEEELARLDRQAKFFAKGTVKILHEAGIERGMRVLDLGCGTGDVTALVASIVGPTGNVVGVDVSDKAIDAARTRAFAHIYSNVTFELADATQLTSHIGRFDAVVGRFILLHCIDPTPIIQRAISAVCRGGVVVFAEMDINSTAMTPRLPLLEECVSWINDLYKGLKLEPDMGSKMYSYFARIGHRPRLSAECYIEGGLAHEGLDFVVDTLVSMKPMLELLKIIPPAYDLRALRRKLHELTAANDYCIVYPRLIGASIRV